VNHLEADTV
jgi:hypothetical protein